MPAAHPRYGPYHMGHTVWVGCAAGTLQTELKSLIKSYLLSGGIATNNKRFRAKKKWSESEFQKPLFSALIKIFIIINFIFYDNDRTHNKISYIMKQKKI